MKERLRVGVLFGGQSPEHDISVTSGLAILQHIDKKRFDPVPIGIDKEGSWHFFETKAFLAALQLQKRPTFQKEDQKFFKKVEDPFKKSFFSPCRLKNSVDVVFPVLHGLYGEDGTAQGLLKLSNLPFVGADVLSSALCMDKSIMKILLREAGLMTPRSKTYHSFKSVDITGLKKEFHFPLFVKPANSGSSIGISKVYDSETALLAIQRAFEYDEKVIVEEYIKGREIECAVLGNLEPIASLPGEILPQHDFYNYHAKYLDPNGAVFDLPAKLPSHILDEIQSLSIKAFKALQCEGMARVDFFLRTEDQVLFINELNTIPGFSPISLYPKLWEISGLSFKELISKLIDLSTERTERRNHCLCSFFKKNDTFVQNKSKGFLNGDADKNSEIRKGSQNSSNISLL